MWSYTTFAPSSDSTIETCRIRRQTYDRCREIYDCNQAKRESEIIPYHMQPLPSDIRTNTCATAAQPGVAKEYGARNVGGGEGGGWCGFTSDIDTKILFSKVDSP